MTQTRQQYLASLTPQQQRENIATAAPVQNPKVITLTPQHEAQVQQAHATGTASTSAPLPQATGPIGQAVQAIEQTRAPGVQGYYPQAVPQQQSMAPQPQQQSMAQQAPWQQMSAWEKYRSLTFPQQIPAGSEVPSGAAAPMTGEDIQMFSPVGMTKNIGKQAIRGAVVETARSLGTNPRNLAKLAPEAIAAIKAITKQGAKYEAIGALAKTPEGVKTIAAGTISKLGKLGELGKSSYTVALKIKSLASIPLTLVGGGIIGSLLRGGTSAQDEATAFRKDIELAIVGYREADPNSPDADRLVEIVGDLSDDFGTIWHTPIWTAEEKQLINNYKDEFGQMEGRDKARKTAATKAADQAKIDKAAAKTETDNAVLTSMIGMTPEEIVSSKEVIEAANENPFIQDLFQKAQARIQKQIDEEQQRLYDQALTEANRRYAESQKAEGRVYTEGQAALEVDDGGSALQFGGGQW